MTLPIQHLDRLPESAREAVAAYATSLSGSLGEDLLALAVYGSAASGEYVPGRSDVNLLAVVRRLDLDVLRRVVLVKAPKRGPRIPAPLMLTPSYLERSLDAFPIEFLEIKENHLLLAGEDLFASITVRTEDLRLQCERELKAHLLRLRQAYLERGRDGRDLERLLHEALNALLPVLRQLVRLRAPEAAPETAARLTREEAIGHLGKTFGVDPAPLLAVERERASGTRIGGPRAEQMLGEMMATLEALSLCVDAWR